MCPPHNYTNIPSGKAIILPKNKSEVLKNAQSKKELLKQIEANEIANLLQEAINWCEKIPDEEFDKIELSENQFLRLGMIIDNSEKIFNIHVYEKKVNSNINVVTRVVISSSENDEDIDNDTVIFK